MVHLYQGEHKYPVCSYPSFHFVLHMWQYCFISIRWLIGFAWTDNSAAGQGTYFLHEYIVPRGSGSFCLYDTRSLSFDSFENTKMFERWMTKGVRDGELVRRYPIYCFNGYYKLFTWSCIYVYCIFTRKSDSMDLKALLKCKARGSHPSSQFRAVNFVIFVVNALSILESMDGDDEKKQQYCQMIATNFNNPLLSFKGAANCYC